MNIINSRRNFIKNMGSGLLGSAALGGGLMPLLANAQTSSSSKYKALVCINLSGGNDAFNTVVPMGASAYSNYQNIRKELALPKETLHALNNSNAKYDAYGFHPALLETSQLFNQGKIAIIPNVGNLIEPANKASYLNHVAKLPTNLFSHADQGIYSQTLNNTAVSHGWAGRIAEAMSGFNINQQLAMNITLSGDNFFQRGVVTPPYSVKKSGVNLINALSEADSNDYFATRAKLFRSFLARSRSNLLQQQYSDVEKNAWVMAQYVTDILKTQPQIDLPIMSAKSANGLSESLATITRLIAANEAFQVKRQIFYVNLGSFDTHTGQLKGQGELLAELNQGLSLFYQTMSVLGFGDQVSVFTMSEFGRTISRNGVDGTDHGWGSHHFVMGDAVKGQQFYGDMPSLELNSDDDVGEGRIIPKLSFDQYAATLSQWFGASSEDTATIFPNLKNFSQKNMNFFV